MVTVTGRLRQLHAFADCRSGENGQVQGARHQRRDHIQQLPHIVDHIGEQTPWTMKKDAANEVYAGLCDMMADIMRTTFPVRTRS